MWPRECPHTTAPGLLFTAPPFVIPAPPFVIPAPHSSFRRRPESRGAGRALWRRGSFSAWGAARSRTLLARRPDIFIPFRLFIHWCTGGDSPQRFPQVGPRLS